MLQFKAFETFFGNLQSLKQITPKMEPISYASFSEFHITDITELSPENYIELWRNINSSDQYGFCEEHVSIAGVFASIFVSQNLFEMFETFLQEVQPEVMALLKRNEQFLKAYIQLKMYRNSFEDVFHLLKKGSFQNTEGLLEIWDEAHYLERQQFLKHGLTSLEKFRVRKRNPPPASICPEGRQLKAMPDRAKAILKNWFLRHQADPYPSKLKKQQLAEETGLTLTQVKTWFANARRHKKQRNKVIKIKEQPSKQLMRTPKPQTDSDINEWKVYEVDVNSNDHEAAAQSVVETYEYTMNHVGLNLEVFDDSGTHVQTVSNIPVIELSNIHTATSANKSVKGEEIEPISRKPDANDSETVSQIPAVVAHNLYTAMSADVLDVSVQNKVNEVLNPESNTFDPESVSKIPLSHVRNSDDVTIINLSDSSDQSKENQPIVPKFGEDICEFQNNAQNVSIARNDGSDKNTNLYVIDQAINAEAVIVPAENHGDLANDYLKMSNEIKHIDKNSSENVHTVLISNLPSCEQDCHSQNENDNHVRMKGTENDNLVHMKETENDNLVHVKETENDNLVHVKETENDNLVHMKGTDNDNLVHMKGTDNDNLVHMKETENDNLVHMKETENDNLVHVKETENDNLVHVKETENDNLVHMEGTENDNHVHMKETRQADKGVLTELAKRHNKKIAVKETLKRSGNVLKEEVDRKLRRLGSLSEKQEQSETDNKFKGNHSFVRSKPTNACTSVTSRTETGKCTKNADRTNSVRLTENFETTKDGRLTKSIDKTKIDDFKFKINKYFDRIKTGRSTEILDLTKSDRLTKNTDTTKIDRFTKTVSTSKTNRFTKNVDTSKTDRFTKATDKDLNDNAFENSRILDTDSQSREYSAEYVKLLLRQKLTSGQNKQDDNRYSNSIPHNAGRQLATTTSQSCTESNRNYSSFQSLTAISELCNRIEYDPACKYNRTSSLLQPVRRKAAHKRPKLSDRFRTAWNESIKNFSLEWFHSKSGYKQDNFKTSHCKRGAVDFSSTQGYRHLHHATSNQMAFQSPKIADEAETGSNPAEFHPRENYPQNASQVVPVSMSSSLWSPSYYATGKDKQQLPGELGRAESLQHTTGYSWQDKYSYPSWADTAPGHAHQAPTLTSGYYGSNSLVNYCYYGESPDVVGNSPNQHLTSISCDQDYHHVPQIYWTSPRLESRDSVDEAVQGLLNLSSQESDT